MTRYLTGPGRSPPVISGLIIFVIGPVMAFYLLGRPAAAGAGAMALIPPGRREEIRGLMDPDRPGRGGFFRGQLLVALFVGVASLDRPLSIGLPFWLLVEMPGCSSLVPLVGPFIGGGLAVIIALLSASPSRPSGPPWCC